MFAYLPAFKFSIVWCGGQNLPIFTANFSLLYRITGYAENNPHSKQLGVRIFLSHQEPGFFQAWNPWSADMPYLSYTSHVHSTLLESPPDHSQHGLFSKALIQAITEAREADSNQEARDSFEVVEGDLEIRVYVGLTAMIYNQSKLGFCKDRGTIFF